MSFKAGGESRALGRACAPPFALGGEAGSVVSECAVQDVVGALTGEKVDPSGTACAVMVRPGQDPRKRPGVKAKPVAPRAWCARPAREAALDFSAHI